MSNDVVCHTGPFRFVLDFLEVDGSDLGVRIHLRIDYSGTWQTLKWTADHQWFEYDELRRFEDALRDGPEARLHDMGHYPVLLFERNASEERLTINPPSDRQSSDGAAIMTRLTIDSGSMRALYEALRDFPKWW